jgi:hypothetical protein
MSPADSTLAIGNQILKVRLAGHRGRVIVDVRYFYRPKNGGELKAGCRGITLSAAALPEIIKALEAITAQMISDGALDEGSPPKWRADIYPSDF